MPDYNYTITVPKSTTKEDPVVTEMKLTKGVIASGEIEFPFGCAGLCHVTINDSRGQLYPSNDGESFHGDGGKVPLVGRHKLDATPYKLYARCWNEDDTYQHKPQIHLAILPEEELKPLSAIEDLIKIFKRLMGLR